MDHAKGMFYYNQHPHDRFLLLIMEAFGYLHQQAKTFLFQCANMVPLVKSNICLLLLVLWAFYRQKVAVTLQRTQASSILRWIGVTNKTSSKLEVIWIFFPLFLFDLLYVIGEGFGIWIWIGAFTSLLLSNVISGLDVGPLFVFFPFLSGLVFFFIQFFNSYFHLFIQQDFLLPCVFNIRVWICH